MFKKFKASSQTIDEDCQAILINIIYFLVFNQNTLEIVYFICFS